MEPQDARRPPSLKDRLDKLNELEADLGNALQVACQIMAELSKEKPPTQKSCDSLKEKFSQSVKKVERELTSEIDHLSQVCAGSSHEGSIYIPVQEKLSAQHRLELINSNILSGQQSL